MVRFLAHPVYIPKTTKLRITFLNNMMCSKPIRYNVTRRARITAIDASSRITDSINSVDLQSLHATCTQEHDEHKTVTKSSTHALLSISSSSSSSRGLSSCGTETVSLPDFLRAAKRPPAEKNVSLSTDPYKYSPDAVPPIHAVSYHLATDKPPPPKMATGSGLF